jgi:hypothetical protein
VTQGMLDMHIHLEAGAGRCKLGDWDNPDGLTWWLPTELRASSDKLWAGRGSFTGSDKRQTLVVKQL